MTTYLFRCRSLIALVALSLFNSFCTSFGKHVDARELETCSLLENLARHCPYRSQFQFVSHFGNPNFSYECRASRSSKSRVSFGSLSVYDAKTRSRETLKLLSALPETAASVAVVATVVGAAATFLIRRTKSSEVTESPRQPDAKQCGFYVMRYMKDIVEACKSLESISLHSVFAGGNYSKMELDEVRTEWAECLQDYVLD